MLFNSLEFAIFLPLVVGIYFTIPYAWRWALLLGSSCVFYMFFIPEYISILALTIVVDYVAALYIERSQGRARKIYLWISIVVTCLILFVFKYFEFVFHSNLGLLLPIGLSFHTFQSLSYVIEVYRGNQKPERHFGIYAVYVMFFPQLVAGPIERPQNLLHQFRERHDFDPVKAASGLRLIVIGLFYKTVVADRLGLIVDFVYDKLAQAPAEARLIASIFFAFQIFADFQGYSSVARGAARLLGFELMQNFDDPYASTSVGEFWRRWHISLSTWFRDYLYLPLGGNRGGALRSTFNLLVTFAVSGLWHGANWTYVVWGALNGFFVAIERALGLAQTKSPLAATRVARRVLTFIAILVTWVFFRAPSISDAGSVLADFPRASMGLVVRLFSGRVFETAFLETLGTSAANLVVAIAGIVAMEILESLLPAPRIDSRMGAWSGGLRWVAYAGIIVAVLISWTHFPESAKPFIYFQF